MGRKNNRPPPIVFKSERRDQQITPPQQQAPQATAVVSAERMVSLQPAIARGRSIEELPEYQELVAAANKENEKFDTSKFILGDVVEHPSRPRRW